MPIEGSYVDLTPIGAPSGVEGRIYYNSSNKKLYYHNGSGWVEMAGGAKIQVTEFTSSGTYNTPSGAKMLIVYIAGAGGGGGSGRILNPPPYGGGGAGGSLTVAVIFNPASSYTVTVGAGGAGATGELANGAKGGDSAFGTIYATGGGGGEPYGGGEAPEYYAHPNTVEPTTSGIFYVSYRGCKGGGSQQDGESGWGHSGGAQSNCGGGGAGPFGDGGGGRCGANGGLTAGGSAEGRGGNGKVVVVAVI